MTTNERQLGEAILGRLSGCPSAEDLQSYRDGTLERREPVERHVASCEPCRAALEFLDDDGSTAHDSAGLPPEVEARTEALVESVSGDARGPAWRWALGLAAAAAVVIVAIQIPRGVDSPAPVTFRQTEPSQIVSLLDEADPLPRAHVVLRWSGVPQGALYDVTVLNSSLGVLDKAARLDGNEYHVPPDRLEGLARGETVFWQVEALLPDGSRVTSVTFVARLE